MQLPPARATLALGLLTAAAWAGLTLAGLGDVAAIAGGFIPARLSAGGQALVEATFGAGGIGLRAGLGDAAIGDASSMRASSTSRFNLLMLGFCGRFVELALGPRLLVLLYLIGAYAGALGQYVADPHGLIPMVGASGAISALFGAYALLFGERRGRLATHRFGKALHVAWLAAAWIGFQLLVGLSTAQAGAAIAVAAHIGGFLAGLLFARPLLRWRYRGA